MHSILIIWQEVPENLKLYKVMATDQEHDNLLKCHNKYINSDLENQDLIAWLMDYLETKTPNFNDTPNQGPMDVLSIDACKVIVTGFIL